MSEKQCNWEIHVEELHELRQSGEDFFLLDVREAHEVERATLGGHHIPLAEVASRLDEIPKGGKVLVHCKLGGRSAKAVVALRQLGFEGAWNVNGGIQAWAERIDPDVPTY